jgi:hypothetical protein
VPPHPPPSRSPGLGARHRTQGRTGQGLAVDAPWLARNSRARPGSRRGRTQHPLLGLLGAVQHDLGLSAQQDEPQ